MNVFPLLNGWKRVIVNSPLYSGNVITVNNVFELANYDGIGWLYSVSVVSTDADMLLRVSVDDNVYESTPHLISIFSEPFEHFSVPAYNVSYENTYVYAIKYYNANGTEFKKKINISVIPSGSAMQVYEYDIEFITVTDVNAFISSYNALYSSVSPTSSSPTVYSTTSQSTKSTTVKDICFG